MIKKAWYAVGPSDFIVQEPRKVTVHGMDYVMYRDESGEVHAFDAYCPHRGCDLALGTVENEEMICPFHGWRFNAEGNCTRVPANRDGSKPPGGSDLIAYYTLEKAGLIWVYTYPQKHLNDKPELSIFPEIESEGWIFAPLQATWNAHFTRTVESVLDISHLPFVHPDTSGTDIIPVVEGPEFSVSDNHIRIHPTPFAPAHPMEPIHPPIGIEERTEMELVFPNKWIIGTRWVMALGCVHF
ncbi:Rieske 2Fe-2S domain-containing protein [Alicyclobacillus tolerans]|uniref:Rieske 2Fe-2S domain-containing protein n=1 Tax=Alicyclobacillus tolerans TaxID=90970 RepID=UPI001F1E157F|nr:Rieske 2Fe-2S domain-containing protein [Alicyclobacillus tolerans]MCF8567450.1 Rieske 2Fe-2S domain-containing protein [Alicyclobacillus tolerans]